MTSTLRALVALVPIALVGCGSGSAAPTSSSSGAAEDPPIQQLVAYSTCMRHHGIPSFPDPTSRGNLVITPADHIDPASPQFKRAQAACKRFSPEGKGVGMTPAEHAKALAAMTRYVECMRKHGIAMADPFNGPNGGVGIVLPRSVDPSSQLYKQADAACRRFVPGGG